MHFCLKAAMIFFVASSMTLQAQAGDANPPIDNQSVTVDFSNVIITPSDKSGYSGMIKVDNTHKIYLKCLSITGDQDMTTLVPCTFENGKLAAEQTTWVPFQTLQAVLFFEPKATSVSGLISGSIGSSTLNSANLLGINADSTPILRVHNPPAEFAYPFSYGSSNPPAGFSLAAAGADTDTGVSVLKLVAQFIGTIAAAPGDANAYYKVNLNSVTWTTKSQYKLKVRTLGDGDGSHDTCAECIDDPPANKITDGDTITLPLGARALITLKDAADGSSIPATFSLDGNPTFNPAISVADQSKGLYMDRLGILFGSGVQISQDSIWVHMGVQSLVITPVDSNRPSIVVKININAPSSLGEEKIKSANGQKVDNNLSYDGLIIKYAHLRGMPPEFIKGQIDQESKFNPNAYRYEPKTTDHDIFYKNPKKLQENSFVKYKLSNTRNPTLLTTQIHPRSTYGILTTNVGPVPIPDNYEESVTRRYTPLICALIMNVNNWGMGSFPAQNWDKSIKNNVVGQFDAMSEFDAAGYLYNQISKNPFLKKYNFVAQTVIAASYGLLQPMFSTVAGADLRLYTDASGVGRNPVDLLNPELNIQIGTTYFSLAFKKANGNKSKEPIGYKTFQDIKNAVRKGYQMYNAGFYTLPSTYDISHEGTYNAKSWSKSKLYFPNGASPIFQ